MRPGNRGMIHGRFQPFHNGHLEYLRGAGARSEVVFVVPPGGTDRADFDIATEQPAKRKRR